MKKRSGMILAGFLAMVAGLGAAEPSKVTLDENNYFRVDGKKFIPLGIWLQPEDKFAFWKDLGINWIVASEHPVIPKRDPKWAGSVESYAKAAEAQSLYFSVGIEWAKESGLFETLAKSPFTLTWHHHDEPDMPKRDSDAVIVPGKSMNVNWTRPYCFMTDNAPNTSAVIDPVVGGEFTIKAKQPVTVEKLGVGLETLRCYVPKEIEFLGDGKPLLKVTLTESNRVIQTFALSKPETFTDLTVKILSIHEVAPDAKIAKWATVAEIQALDKDGKNVLAEPLRLVPRVSVETIMEAYRYAKDHDPSHPVSLTLMARFMVEKELQGLGPIDMSYYRQFMDTCDVAMFDLYPISMWGKNLYYNGSGLDQLRKLSGSKKSLGVWLQSSDRMNLKTDPGLTAGEIRANTWQSLVHGAASVCYFPQAWTPRFKFLEINKERQDAIRKVNREVTELTDLICGPVRTDLFKVEGSGDARLDVMQRQEGDKALLVLVYAHLERKGEPITLSVTPDKFKPGAVPVYYGTDTKVTDENGTWKITLKPWETAVLVVDKAK